MRGALEAAAAARAVARAIEPGPDWGAGLEHCPWCGEIEAPVRVHGHVQCRTCGAVVERCCE